MGRLALTRGKLFDMIALTDIGLADGTLMVKAGTVGAAVIEWGGDRRGYFVEWERGGACGVLASFEGRAWMKVQRPAGMGIVQ